jgi:hypothetical protein
VGNLLRVVICKNIKNVRELDAVSFCLDPPLQGKKVGAENPLLLNRYWIVIPATESVPAVIVNDPLITVSPTHTENPVSKPP